MTNTILSGRCDPDCVFFDHKECDGKRLKEIGHNVLGTQWDIVSCECGCHKDRISTTNGS